MIPKTNSPENNVDDVELTSVETDLENDDTNINEKFSNSKILRKSQNQLLLPKFLILLIFLKNKISSNDKFKFDFRIVSFTTLF